MIFKTKQKFNRNKPLYPKMTLEFNRKRIIFDDSESKNLLNFTSCNNCYEIEAD